MAAGYGILTYISEWDREDKPNAIWQKNIEIMDKFFDFLCESNHFGMVGAFKVKDEELFYKSCFNSDLLVTKTGKDWIKIAPPIIIDSKSLEKGLDILRKYVS